MPQPNSSEYDTFDPRLYLAEYYDGVGDENSALLTFFADAYRDFSPDSLDVVELGGPTIYS